MMKIGMNLFLWTDHPKFEDHARLVETLKRWGFDGVEFPVSAMSDADIGAFSSLCDDLGIGRTALGIIGADRADPASEDPRLRMAALDLLKREVDKAKQLGSGILAGPYFQGLGRFTGRPPSEDEWKRSVETIRPAAEYAREAGIRLALEPLNRFEMYMVNTVRQGAEFVRQVGLDNVGLLVDTHHANIEENDITDALCEHSAHIFHLHLSENHRGTPGTGHAIPPDLFERVPELPHVEWLTLESFGHRVPGLIPLVCLWRKPDDEPDQVATRGLEFVRNGLAKARRQ